MEPFHSTSVNMMVSAGMGDGDGDGVGVGVGVGDGDGDGVGDPVGPGTGVSIGGICVCGGVIVGKSGGCGYGVGVYPPGGGSPPGGLSSSLQSSGVMPRQNSIGSSHSHSAWREID